MSGPANRDLPSPRNRIEDAPHRRWQAGILQRIERKPFQTRLCHDSGRFRNAEQYRLDVEPEMREYVAYGGERFGLGGSHPETA